MTFRQDEMRKGREARHALPPVARDFYEEEHSTGYPGYSGSPDSAPRWTFLGLRCKVCRHIGDHRPSCPVPKAERALKAVAEAREAKRRPREEKTTDGRDQ